MQSILLVSHQLDYSGAPRALLAAAKLILEMGFSVDLIALADGPMEQEFQNIGVRRIRSTDFKGYRLVVLNTAICAHIALRIPPEVKFALWIHESPYLFIHTDIPLVVCQAAATASAILFPTESTAAEWSHFGPLRFDRRSLYISLAPVEISVGSEVEEASFYSMKERVSSFRIITIDPLEYFRGYKVLATALKLIYHQKLDLELVSVGVAKDQFKQIFAFMQESQVKPFTRIPRHCVLELLRSSDLYLSNSSFATQNLGMCEASIAGIPTLVSDIPVHRTWAERLPGSAWTYKLFDAVDLATKINLIIKNYRPIRELSMLNRETAKAFLSDKSLRLVISNILSRTS
jgi:glycosyltransferase involved in cell wall biosynthesis